VEFVFFLAVTFGIRAENRAGSGNFNYQRECDFVFLWGWDTRFASEKEDK